MIPWFCFESIFNDKECVFYRELSHETNTACLVCAFFLREYSFAEPRIALRDLESELTASPEVLAAAASLSESRAIEERQKMTGGSRFFGELSLSGLNEPASRSDTSVLEGYSKLWVRGGVSIPLFGTWRKERIRELESRILSLEEELRLLAVRKANLTALRKAYALLWTIQERKSLLERFLALEERIMPLLAKRAEEGFLLERDRLEMESWFAFARREAAADASLKEECLALIRKATGRGGLSDLEVLFPHLEPRFFSEDVLARAAGEENRELQILTEAAETKREIARRVPKAQYDAYLRAGYGFSSEFPGRNGTEAFLSIAFDVPFREGRAASAAGRAARAGAEKAGHEMEARRLAIVGDIRGGILRFDSAAAQRAFAMANARSAAEAVRADRLRYSLLPGDVLEQLFRSLFIYFSSALDFVDSEGALLQAHCELLGMLPETGDRGEGKEIASFFPEEPERHRLLAPSWLAFPSESPSAPAVGKPVLSPKGQMFYFWKGDDLLYPGKGRAFFEQAAKEGVSGILVSFSPRGIAFLRTAGGKARLDEALEAARRAGVRAELLLGDPSWILAAHRKELTDLVRELGGFAFSGIHLDLEPDQLPDAEARRMELLLSLTETVREVKRAARLPVSLSVHPRYLEGSLGPVAAKGFGAAGVDEIAVMIYSTKVDSVASRMKAILSSWPGLRFRLALSVERELPPSESFFKGGKKSFLEAVDFLQGELASSSFAGTVVQSWENYKEMAR